MSKPGQPLAVPLERPVRPGSEALTVERILEIRDALLPSEGEQFDCVAFAVEIVKAERARAADAGTSMPEPYTRQWINAPFTERLLFTDEQMRQYAAAAAAGARALADSEGTRAVEYLRRARKAEAELERLRVAAADVARVWSSPSWNWSHTGRSADAMNALAAALGPNVEAQARAEAAGRSESPGAPS